MLRLGHRIPPTDSLKVGFPAPWLLCCSHGGWLQAGCPQIETMLHQLGRLGYQRSPRSRANPRAVAHGALRPELSPTELCDLAWSVAKSGRWKNLKNPESEDWISCVSFMIAIPARVRELETHALATSLWALATVPSRLVTARSLNPIRSLCQEASLRFREMEPGQVVITDLASEKLCGKPHPLDKVKDGKIMQQNSSISSFPPGEGNL